MKRGASGINLLLGIDKPEGCTSHDVVARVRRALGEKRVGHAGTLDPAATGVLIVGVGQATRLLGRITLDDKSYLARISFGAATDTDDAEGEVIAEAPVPAELADEAFARRYLAGLVGVREQVPPAYSAISVDGRRAYARARAGEEVALEPRTIEIASAELVSIDDADGLAWNVAFEVSKGSYIRALARDIGLELGTRAHLSGLRRTSSGPVRLASCIPLDALAEADLDKICLDPASVLGCSVRALSADEVAAAAQGKRIDARNEPFGEDIALVCGDTLVGVWRRRADSLVSAVNLPEGVKGVRHAR